MRLVAVKPALTRGDWSRRRAWTRTAPRAQAGARAQARKSGRFLRRSILNGTMEDAASVTPTPLPETQVLGAEALAALGAATGEHLLAVLRRHAQTEAVAAGANEARGLESPLHGMAPGSKIERRWIVEGGGGVNRAAGGQCIWPPRRRGASSDASRPRISRMMGASGSGQVKARPLAARAAARLWRGLELPRPRGKLAAMKFKSTAAGGAVRRPQAHQTIRPSSPSRTRPAISRQAVSAAGIAPVKAVKPWARLS